MGTIQLEDNAEACVQPIHPASSHIDSNGLPTTISTASTSDADISHIQIHLDSNGKEVIFWEDILMAYKDAVNIHHESRVPPFLKAKELNIIRPLRFAAIHNATLDIYIETNITQEERDTARTRSTSPHTLPPPKRSPQYDPHEQAFWVMTSLRDLSSSPLEFINIGGREDFGGLSPANNPHTTPEPGDIITQLEIKAYEGDMNAQVKLGQAYLSGYKDFLDPLPETAMKWFLQAAERGHPTAQYYVGLLHYQGRGVSVNYETAVEWFMKAADKKDRPSQIFLGEMYLHGQGVKKDSLRALQWLLPLANEGHADGQYHIGFMHSNGIYPFPQNYSLAMEWYRKAADQGHAGAQVEIGKIHSNGHGIFMRDESTALTWFLMAAEQGDPVGQNLAGDSYEYVNGHQDYSKAMVWYLRAAEQGCRESQFAVGRLNEHTIGETNYTEAFEWYLRAAEQGHMDAQVRVARMYYERNGFASPGDLMDEEWYLRAKQWYLKAYDQGSEDALYGLALMYRRGHGVNRDFDEAKRLYELIGNGAAEDFADTLREEEEWKAFDRFI
ncbi:hypothetical protein EC991_006928 [Linnemannia zychae]|nr:hypothetical protein EC991_006928 [Linnemannia zychae]